MRVIREEIFGPVVCATPFGDDDLDAIAKQANDTIYGLAASVWTLQYNYGPGFGREFLDAYGASPMTDVEIERLRRRYAR